MRTARPRIDRSTHMVGVNDLSFLGVGGGVGRSMTFPS